MSDEERPGTQPPEGGDGALAGTSSAVDDDARRKRLSELQEKLKKLKEKEKKKGVIYISRIPPNMKPRKLKSLLEPYGDIGRVYLAPRKIDSRKKDKIKANTGIQFGEGWVEFLDKRVARDVAETLNGQIMGGRKRSAHYHDLWSLKYLPKFKWDDLTDEAVYKHKVRDQKMAVEISAAKRERDFYLQQVAQSKAVAAMEERRKRKREAAGGEGAAGAGTEEPRASKVARTPGQHREKDTSGSKGKVSSKLLAMLGGKA